MHKLIAEPGSSSTRQQHDSNGGNVFDENFDENLYFT